MSRSRRPGPGGILRDLQAAQQVMKKVRKQMADLRELDEIPEEVSRDVLAAGWNSLTRTHALLAAIEPEQASDEVMHRMIAVQRYATSLLVRLRRLGRGGGGDALVDDDAETDGDRSDTSELEDTPDDG